MRTIAYSDRRAWRTLGGLGLAVAVIIPLVSCAPQASDTDGGSPGGGSNAGVAFGASDAEWKAAFADVEPRTLTLELTAGATSESGIAATDFADEVKRLSDGKITFEVAHSHSVSGSQAEAPNALLDGRLDISMVSGFLNLQEFPIGGGVAVDLSTALPPSPVLGGIAGYGAMNETLFQFPELKAELDSKGFTVLMPYVATPSMVVACADKSTLKDGIAGKQVRAASALAATQVKAMGATPVSIPFSDLLESVQRGIVDCIVAGVNTINIVPGLAGMLPFIFSPADTSIVTTGSQWVAGPSWKDLPLVAQQLIFDRINAMEFGMKAEGTITQPASVHDAITKEGGGFFELDAAANKALVAENAGLMKEWRASTQFDGKNLIETFEAEIERWLAMVEKTDLPKGELWEVDWSKADPSMTDDIVTTYLEEIAKYRPGA